MRVRGQQDGITTHKAEASPYVNVVASLIRFELITVYNLTLCLLLLHALLMRAPVAGA